MSEITRFAVRTSGRVLTDVRRPTREQVIAKAERVAAANEAEAAAGAITEDDFTRRELVEMAEARGLDSTGNKAALVERLNG